MRANKKAKAKRIFSLSVDVDGWLERQSVKTGIPMTRIIEVMIRERMEKGKGAA